MKKFIFALCMLLLPALALAKIPDEEDILRKTMDSSSPFYYPALLMRYNNCEELSDDEYHYLYYGYAYTTRITSRWLQTKPSTTYMHQW